MTIAPQLMDGLIAVGLPGGEFTRGQIVACNAAIGQTLWTFDGTTIRHGGGAQAAPIAYVLGGTEYIVNAFGADKEDRDSYPPNPVGEAVVALACRATLGSVKPSGS